MGGYSPRLSAELLRQRVRRGLSQEEVKEKAGLGSQNLVSMLERNVLEKPGMEDLVKLGALYGLEPNDLAQIAGWWQPRTPPQDGEATKLLQELGTLDLVTRQSVVRLCRKLVLAEQLSQGTPS